jgi:hypothetical protein
MLRRVILRLDMSRVMPSADTRAFNVPWYGFSLRLLSSRVLSSSHLLLTTTATLNNDR